MHIFGITGGIGAGKSQIMDFLRTEYQARIILADEVGHDLMKSSGACYADILKLFGQDVLDGSGELDRRKIGARAFQDPELLDALDAIVHPAVKRTIIQAVEDARKNHVTFFFMEAALLIEEKYDEICDELWYIYTDESVRRERLKAGRGYSDAKIDTMLAHQLSDSVYRSHCSFVIDNSGSFSDTAQQIRAKMDQYCNRS